MSFLPLSTTDFKSYLEELKPIYTKYKDYALTKVDQRIVLAAAVLTTVAVGLYYSSSKIAVWYKGKKIEENKTGLLKQLQDIKLKLNDLEPGTNFTEIIKEVKEITALLRIDSTLEANNPVPNNPQEPNVEKKPMDVEREFRRDGMEYFLSLVENFNFFNNKYLIEKEKNDLRNELSQIVTRIFETLEYQSLDLTFFEQFVFDKNQNSEISELVAIRLGNFYEKEAEAMFIAGSENQNVFLYLTKAFNFFKIGLVLKNNEQFEVDTNRVKDKISLLLDQTEFNFFEDFVLDESQSIESRALVASQLGKLFEKKSENIAKKAGKENHEVFLFALQAFNFFNISLNLQNKEEFKADSERMRDKIDLVIKNTSELDFFEDFLFEDSKFPEIRGLIANHLGDLCEDIATQTIDNQDVEIGISNFWEPAFVAFDFFDIGDLLGNEEAKKNSIRLRGIIKSLLNFDNINEDIQNLKNSYSLVMKDSVEIECEKDKEIAEKVLKEITFFTDFMFKRSKNLQLREIILNQLVGFYKNERIIRSNGETVEIVEEAFNEEALRETSKSEENRVKANTTYSSPWKKKDQTSPASDRLDKVKKTLSFKDETP